MCEHFFLSHNSNVFESRSLFALFAFVVVIISGVHFPILSMLAPATISANVDGSGGRANQFETHPCADYIQEGMTALVASGKGKKKAPPPHTHNPTLMHARTHAHR